jgi:hypothetical protein
MLLYEQEISLPIRHKHEGLLAYISREVLKQIPLGKIPVRFVVTQTDNKGYHCELGVMSDVNYNFAPSQSSIFEFSKRSYENIDQFNAVLLIPTGVDAEIGGHSGDGGPVARLLASACDTLITHPNVVNAADINELPENGLYVEGSIIARLLMGTVGLQKVRSNRLLLIMDKHEDEYFCEATINSVSAARAAMGLDCPVIVKMDEKIRMDALLSSSGRAVGRIEHLERICELLTEYRSQFDAVAISSLINLTGTTHAEYFSQETINPWGGVEAMLTHAISMLFNVPSAHSPMMESKEIMNMDVGIVEPRKAAEAISLTFLHCILKGLHKSPRIVTNPADFGRAGVLSAADISCLVIPDGCVGLPTLAALEQGIPVIAVKENRNRMQNRLEDFPFAQGQLFVVENYLEAVGVMNALKAGVAPESVRRPLCHTKVVEAQQEEIQSAKQNTKTLDFRAEAEKKRKTNIL